MLQTYHAEITGSHLKWLGAAPAHLLRQHAVIVFEAPLPQALPEPAASRTFRDARGALGKSTRKPTSSFMAARGALGKSTREEVLAELAAMRDEWER